MFTLLFLSFIGATLGDSLDPQAWLVNCVDKSSSKYSEIALYEGWPNGQPASTILVPTTYNTSVAWAYSYINETFPDGMTFAVSDMVTQMNQKPFNAPAQLGEDEIVCTPHMVEDLYTKIDGSTCSSVYQCAHPNVIKDGVNMETQKDASTSVHQVMAQKAAAASDATKIVFMSYGDKFTLNGQIHPNDIFWSVWSQRNDYHFLGQEIQFGPDILTSFIPFKTDKCTIKFEGHGDIPWTTTNGLAQTLLSVVNQPGFVTTTTSKIRICTDPCDHSHGGNACCGWGWDTQQQTTIPARMDMNVINVPIDGSGRNPSDQGELHYTINCPMTGSSLGCEICKLLGFATQSGGLSKDVGTAFNAANVILNPICSLAGC